MPDTRTETDSFGPIEVPADALWGAQTARSLRFFAIGEQRMPLAIVHALAEVKWAAAEVNRELGLLDAGQGRGHRRRRGARGRRRVRRRVPALGVADRLGHAEQHERQRGDRQPGLAGARRRARARQRRVHPNDDVNLGQSSNDVFPTAMHIAVALQTRPLLRGARASCAARCRPRPRRSPTSSRSAAPTCRTPRR